MAIITPFRYPGSKNKMLPVLMEYIKPLVEQDNKFIDVFVGGGSVLLEVAQKFPKAQLFANDKDYWIYSFWKIVGGTDTNKLNDLLALVEVKPTLELFYKLREEDTKDELRCAYKAIFFNRTAFSGILYSGPIGGKDQKSQYTVDCRYNAKKLKTKILACHKLLSGRTQVDNEDFCSYKPLLDETYSAYLDPPYYVKGNILYIEHMKHEEHENLSKILAKRSNWVLSYDDCPEIRGFYNGSNVVDLAARYCIQGKKSSWDKKNELIITSS